MAFAILNDPAAPVNPATFGPQSSPDKVDFDIMAASLAGCSVVSGCAVTAQGSPNMTVAVAAGVAQVNGVNVTVAGGNVTITAAPGNGRFDLVVVDNTGAKSAVAGTNSTNPCFPAIPANSVVLAAVYVPSGTASIDATRIIDKRMMTSTPSFPIANGLAGGQTIIGGTSASDVLTLQGAGANSGSIRIDSPVRFYNANQTLTGTIGGGAGLFVINKVFTLDFANAQFCGGGSGATSPGVFGVNFTLALNQSGANAVTVAYAHHATYKNVNGVSGITIPGVGAFDSRSTYQADGATLTVGSIADIFSNQIFSTINSGVLSLGSDYVGFECFVTVGTGITVPQYRGFVMKAPANSGTITQLVGYGGGTIGSSDASNCTWIAVPGLQTSGVNIGVDIAAPSGGTTNIALRAAGSILCSSASAGIGYTTGAGSSVTQLTSKSTATPAINRQCGSVTMNNAALAAGTIVSFVLTNNTIAATDLLILNHISGGTPGSYTLNGRCAAGSATIDVRNNTAGTLSEAIVIEFAVIKGVTS